MTDDSKQRVLSREAREKLAQLECQFPDRPTERRILERRKKEEPEEHLHYRETDGMAARRLQAEHDAAWNAWLDARLDERLQDERDFMVEAVGTALGEATADLRDEIDEQRKKARQQLHEEVKLLRAELCELSTVVSELRKVIASEHARVLDLPALPQSRRVN
jgi:hypothetical protein